MPKLLELVYESSDVLDVVFATQRSFLRSELGKQFRSYTLRGLRGRKRHELLKSLAADPPSTILLRGTNFFDEVSAFFPKSVFFLDYLGKAGPPPAGSFAGSAYKIKRAFAYSEKGENILREAGLSAIKRFCGPGLPDLSSGLGENDRPAVAVLDTDAGALDALRVLKKRRREKSLDFDLLSTVKMGGVITYGHTIEAAEDADLLVVPVDQPDHGGPHEGAILALSLQKALCTSTTSAFFALPHVVRGKILEGKKYSPGTFGLAFENYRGSRDRLDSAFKDLNLNPLAVPQEVLERM